MVTAGKVDHGQRDRGGSTSLKFAVPRTPPSEVCSGRKRELKVCGYANRPGHRCRAQKLFVSQRVTVPLLIVNQSRLAAPEHEGSGPAPPPM